MTAGKRAKTLFRRISSTEAAVDRACMELRVFLGRTGLERVVFIAELLAREFLNNAVVHGNARSRTKNVTLRLVIGRRWLWLEITDEGEGFNWRSHKGRPLPDGMEERGRGLAIGSRYAERVAYNRRGNRVTVKLEKPAKGEAHGRVYAGAQ